MSQKTEHKWPCNTGCRCADESRGCNQGVYCMSAAMPDEAQGFGRIAAARGSLGHRPKVKTGRIQNCQIAAPTTWNLSPRDARDNPGALEQALVGAPVRDGEVDPVAEQHIVRSFDPCMVCTVH